MLESPLQVGVLVQLLQYIYLKKIANGLPSRFTKRLRRYRNFSYTDRLIKLALPSLELRRLHLDLIYCYKIVFGLIKLNFSDFFEFSSLPTRGHAYKLYKSRSANIRVNFFACRVVNVWNSLPDTVCFTSLAVF